MIGCYYKVRQVLQSVTFITKWDVTYGNKVYTNFRGSNVPDDNIECKSFTIISIDSLLVYENKYYLQVYLDNCAYEIVNKQMTNYLNDSLFKN